jgi:PAS domain-containing protein
VQAASGAIVAATPVAEEILGLTFEEMIPAMRALTPGGPVRDAVMGAHRPRADPAGKHVWLSVSSVPIRRSADEPPVVLTTHSSTVRRMRHADGRYVWVETTVRVTAGPAASAARMQTSSRNVDDRVAAQHAQADAEAGRDSAVRLFRAAMEHAAIVAAPGRGAALRRDPGR